MTEDIEVEDHSSKMQLAYLVYEAIKQIPQDLEIIPINYTFAEAARKNDKRPAYLKFWVPDEWVINFTNNKKLLDGYVAIRVPRKFVEESLEEDNYGRVEPEQGSINTTGLGVDGSEVGSTGHDEHRTESGIILPS